MASVFSRAGKVEQEGVDGKEVLEDEPSPVKGLVQRRDLDCVPAGILGLDPGAGIGGDCDWTGFQHPDQGFQVTGVQQVVIVEKQGILPAGTSKSGIRGFRPGQRRTLLVLDSDSELLSGGHWLKVGSATGVDDHYLDDGPCLTGYGLQCIRK